MEYKKFHKNPRHITPERISKLKESILEYGDLSGIVHDETSDQIIGGNQRSKALDLYSAEIKIHEKYETPLHDGTIAIGYFIVDGETYNYRKVRWPKEKCDSACIVANRLHAEWDYGVLKEFSHHLLVQAGFEKLEVENIFNQTEKTVDAVLLTVGPYRQKITLQEYSKFNEKITGMDKKQISEYVLKLLAE